MDRGYWLLAGCALTLAVGGFGAYAIFAGQNTHSSAAYLDVDTADGNVSGNETVAFDDLSPAQQEVFERARNSTEMVDIPPDTDYVVFVDNHYVRYRNRTYQVAVAVGN
ncbi:hypothetical protein [Haloarcula onubensis]|uniref:DUF7979 domain-containing protein n=1 Tax=Haloarcula onubensis TaxID=2950539 RepID=A0ABU2FSC3_9EURY|nr:hypothetical protein [Halomicroarcula sp. S3CR25-11]MDS0283056.1 hypothetical protein [Halomicroarcula sp. S3CR25-11]